MPTPSPKDHNLDWLDPDQREVAERFIRGDIVERERWHYQAELNADAEAFADQLRGIG